jgi:predicted nucleotide-binding protein
MMTGQAIQMSPEQELFTLADTLKKAAEAGEADDIDAPLNALDVAGKEVARSFSGSWLGYHSRVYHAGFSPPPPGAHFSQEWGLQKRVSYSTRGDWHEYDAEGVKEYIRELAGNPSLDAARSTEKSAKKIFENSKAQIVSILETENARSEDSFLGKLKGEIEELKALSPHEVAQIWSPKGTKATRDMIVVGQGNQIPPHISIRAEAVSLRHTFSICQKAADISRQAASHIERKARGKRADQRIGTNVFIGHGRSGAWRELKDFIADRLGLPWDEFNRVPVAGVTNIARLSEMLDAAAIALIIMTAEDEMADGEIHARMNVIHEVGLFQGRLGFTKAIVLFEEGCKEFTNIQGLGQIRFPKGRIAAVFEEIRLVLEREGLVEN